MFKTQKEIESQFRFLMDGLFIPPKHASSPPVIDWQHWHSKESYEDICIKVKDFLHSTRQADKEAVREMIRNETDKFACAIVVPESEIPNTIIFNKGAQSALSDLLAQLDKWEV